MTAPFDLDQNLAAVKLELGANYQSRAAQYRGLGAVAGMGISPMRVAIPIAVDVSRRGGDSRLFLAAAQERAMTFMPRTVGSGWQVRFKVSPAPDGFNASVALTANESPNEPLSCEFHFATAAATVN